MNEHIYDYLRDFMKNIYPMQIKLIRVEGTESETTLSAVDEQRTVVIQGKTKTPILEFIGVFGMPALDNLNTILGITEYKENAKFSVTKKADGILSGIDFENAAGDFKNNYRFMSQELANEQLKQLKFKGATWLETITPSESAIQKFGYQSSANSAETMFTFDTKDGNLNFNFGDHSSQSGNFVFEPNVKATFKKSWAWPVAVFKNIMALPGAKQLKLSDEGVILITVDSGFTDYQFLVPAVIK